MEKKLISICCIFVLIFSSIYIPVTAQNQDYSDYNNPIKPNLLKTPNLNKSPDFPINIVFLGFNESRVNETLIKQNIGDWYAPIERIPSTNTQLRYDINYSLSYNFKYIDNTTILNQYSKFLDSNGQVNRAPFFAQSLTNESLYVPSSKAENFLVNLLNGTQPTFVVIDTYSYNPSAHKYYYYNATSIDLDGSSVPRRYGSTYQISGGGEKNPLLWIDLSSGPTKYRDDTPPPFQKSGVNRKLIPPIWDYEANEINNLSRNISIYLQSAIELRFLPSYLYTPKIGHTNVNLQFNLINLAENYNFTQKIRAQTIVDKYSALNPSIEWSHDINKINLTTTPDLKEVIENAKNNITREYEASPIYDYFRNNYDLYVSPNTADRLNIPVFLFGFPEDYMFDQYLGVAAPVDNEFAFILAGNNEYFASTGYKLSDPNWFTNDTISLEPGNFTKISGKVGAVTQKMETSINVTEGSLNLHILDTSNYENYTLGNSFDTIQTFSGITGHHRFNLTNSIYSKYHWVLENPSGSSASAKLNISSFDNISFGFTFVAMHEIGHALGLSHPHDGWSWHGVNKIASAKSTYLYWLWDLSYTQMSYAHHYRNISYMDIQSYQRGIIPKVYGDLIRQFSEFKQLIATENKYLPAYLKDPMLNITQGLKFANKNFTDIDTINALNTSITILTELLNDLDQAIHKYKTSQLSKIITIKFTEDIEDTFVRLLISFNNSTVFNDTVSNNQKINLSDISWTDSQIKVINNDKTVFQANGYTWQLPGIIEISAEGVITYNPTTSEKSSSHITSNGGFLSYYYLGIIFTLIIFPIIKRLHQKFEQYQF